MSALVKFNDRNHVETTVLPTYHFQNALPALVLFSIRKNNFALLWWCGFYSMTHINGPYWKLEQAIPKVEDSCKLYYESLEGLKSSSLIEQADLERTKKLLKKFQEEDGAQLQECLNWFVVYKKYSKL